MKKIVTFGEVLLRLATEDNLRFTQANRFTATYGGSELNVAIALAQLGLPTEFITRLPDTPLSKTAVLKLRSYGVYTDNIIYGGNRLGLYFMETGAGMRGTRIVYDRAHSAMAEIKRGGIEWEQVLKDASWFHWSGITAGISEGAAAVCAEAISVAKKMGIKISTDFNYRSNLWNYGKTPNEIMEPMVAACDVVLAGDYACEKYFGIISQSNSDKNLSIAHQLQERFPRLSKIAITNREVINASYHKWSAHLFADGQLLASPIYKITHIVDRIGAGDSFMAGLIWGLINLKNDKESLDFATAASALKHTIYGDANLVTQEEISQLAKGENMGHVSR